jgi:hypothetical protein
MAGSNPTLEDIWRLFQETDRKVLEGGAYRNSDSSRQFPWLPLTQRVPELLEACKRDGRNKTLKAFRRDVAGNSFPASVGAN